MAEETYVMWGKILTACDEVNASSATLTIQRLGCTLEVNFWPAGATDAEQARDLQGIRHAYREYCGSR